MFPLYPSETEVAKRVLGSGRINEWKGIAIILERQGFPQIEPLFGGRYWPACEMWFRGKHKIGSLQGFQKPDGVESCPPRRNPQGSLGENDTAAQVFRIGSLAATSSKPATDRKR